MTEPTGDWWANFYDAVVSEMYLDRDDAELDATTAFLRKHLELAPGDRVLDQCCGVGTLSLALAKQGLDVVGVDLCREYIDAANASKERLGLATRFVCDDAFAFVAEPVCRGVFNWYTSFGYAEENARNRAMLQRARDSLEPEGWFALDYPNVAYLLRNFQPCIVRRHPTNSDIMLVRESTLDLVRGQLVQTWTCLLPEGRRRTTHSRVRLYLPHELEAMVRESGFTDVRFFGSVQEEPLSPESVRCILLARRAST